MNFVCPRCKGELSFSDDLYSCSACRQDYPVLYEIPDFRVNPDPYIAPAEDRKRGQLLAEWGRERTYAELLDCYYSLAPDVPPPIWRNGGAITSLPTSRSLSSTSGTHWPGGAQLQTAPYSTWAAHQEACLRQRRPISRCRLGWTSLFAGW